MLRDPPVSLPIPTPPHHALPLASPCPFARFLPINIVREDDCSWETPPLGTRTLLVFHDHPYM